MTIDPLLAPDLRAGAAPSTPFSDRVRALSWHVWRGHRVPLACEALETEASALRLACGMVDLTPLSVLRLEGAGALEAVERVTTIRGVGMLPGNVYTGLICTGDGRVIAVADLHCWGPEDVVIVTEPSILPWLEDAVKGFAVRLGVETATLAVLGLFGRGVDETLKRCGLTGEPEGHHGGLWTVARHGLMVKVIRPDGPGGPFGLPDRAEIWAEPGDAPAVWDLVLRQAGGLARPVGYASLESARIRAGWPRIGQDCQSPETAIDLEDALDPFDLGLDSFIDFDKPAFSGRAALLARRDHGDPERSRLLRVALPGPATVEQRLRRGETVARLTSVAQDPVTRAWSGLAVSRTPAPLLGGPWLLDGGTAHGLPAQASRPAGALRA